MWGLTPREGQAPGRRPADRERSRSRVPYAAPIMDIETLPLTEARWPDLETVFLGKGCSMARGCWCMYYRESGRVTPPPWVHVSDDRRVRARALAGADPPAGLLGYADGVPVGWVAIAPRS